MSIYRGNMEITGLKLGGLDIAEVYKGSTKIWPANSVDFDKLVGYAVSGAPQNKSATEKVIAYIVPGAPQNKAATEKVIAYTVENE
jgi:hypothetical protein